MPFKLYDIVTSQGPKKYTFVRTVPIAGNTGPLATIQKGRNTGSATPFRWHASSEDIVALVGSGPSTQEIVIDLKPKDTKNVSLYRLLDVWGFSYADWTPVALRLQALFVDFPHDEPARFKESFTYADANPELVGEFLYVQGGTRAGGTWNWGQVGRVNGALLWRDAFDYLSGELSKTL